MSVSSSCNKLASIRYAFLAQSGPHRTFRSRSASLPDLRFVYLLALGQDSISLLFFLTVNPLLSRLGEALQQLKRATILFLLSLLLACNLLRELELAFGKLVRLNWHRCVITE